jgi:hypothetical protein
VTGGFASVSKPGLQANTWVRHRRWSALLCRTIERQTQRHEADVKQG